VTVTSDARRRDPTHRTGRAGGFATGLLIALAAAFAGAEDQGYPPPPGPYPFEVPQSVPADPTRTPAAPAWTAAGPPPREQATRLFGRDPATAPAPPATHRAAPTPVAPPRAAQPEVFRPPELTPR
jgi:hypothetical protein